MNKEKFTQDPNAKDNSNCDVHRIQVITEHSGENIGETAKKQQGKQFSQTD